MDIMEIHKTLSALLDKLKRNRELVSLAELKTKYRKPYTALCEEIRTTTIAYVQKAALQEFVSARRILKKLCLLLKTQYTGQGCRQRFQPRPSNGRISRKLNG